MELPQAIYLFADLVNSTGYKEQHRFDTGWQKIQDFISETIKVVKKYNGLPYRIMGDAVVVKIKYTGSDESEPFIRVLSMAYDILIELDSFNGKNKLLKPKGLEKIEVRIGISFGYVKEFIYDDQIKDDIGECIDEAARLSSITSPNTVIFPVSLRSHLTSDYCPLNNSKCSMLSHEVKKIKLKGKEKKEDYVIIGLEDIKRCVKISEKKRCGNKSVNKMYRGTVASFLESRPLEDVLYIAFGGFMYSNKKGFAESLAKRIENKLKNTQVALIYDNNKDNPFLSKLNKCIEKDEHYEALATQTNLWYMYHHVDCINKCFNMNKAKGVFISDFYLDYDLLYSDVDGANGDLVKHFYDITKKAVNIYKEPDFVILLEAPQKYYLEEAQNHPSDPKHINFEKYMDKLIEKYDLRFMEPNKRKYYKINIESIFEKNKKKETQKMNEELNNIYRILLEEGILYE